VESETNSGAATPVNRFLISAAHKSSGKTVVSAGLAAALTQRGHQVSTFKKGPDYILHVKAILRKLELHSRVEAAVMAVEHGIRRRVDGQQD